METKKNQIYNLIILDESGSMSCVTNQTISGCNETLNTIRSAQQKYADTQEHFVSIYAFQSDGRPSRYIFKNMPVGEVKNITDKDYEPWGCTPLNDAVGMTLADLKATTKSKENAIGSVTIITDGYENASREYTIDKVAQMISQLKELGWSFNFIGANIDVIRTASAYNIDNTLEFQQDEEGTRKMFHKERSSRMKYYGRVQACMMAPDSVAEESAPSRMERLKEAAKGYFDDEKEED